MHDNIQEEDKIDGTTTALIISCDSNPCEVPKVFGLDLVTANSQHPHPDYQHGSGPSTVLLSKDKDNHGVKRAQTLSKVGNSMNRLFADIEGFRRTVEQQKKGLGRLLANKSFYREMEIKSKYDSFSTLYDSFLISSNAEGNSRAIKHDSQQKLENDVMKNLCSQEWLFEVIANFREVIAKYGTMPACCARTLLACTELAKRGVELSNDTFLQIVGELVPVKDHQLPEMHEILARLRRHIRLNDWDFLDWLKFESIPPNPLLTAQIREMKKKGRKENGTPTSV